MRVGLLTDTSISDFRIKTLMPVLEDSSISIKLAVVDGKQPLSIIQRIIKNMKRGRGGYILIMALEVLFSKKEKSVVTQLFCKQHGIDFFITQNLYSSETVNKIKEYNLDILLLIGGYNIIKEPILSATPLGVLSYHHGNMRKYRGMPPGMWELYNGENEMGITVQILASGLDCGRPVEEKNISINKNDNFYKLRNRAMNESTIMMYDALKKLSDKNFVPGKIDKFGKVYTLPDLRQWIILNTKLLIRKFTS